MREEVYMTGIERRTHNSRELTSGQEKRMRSSRHSSNKSKRSNRRNNNRNIGTNIISGRKVDSGTVGLGE